MGRYVPSALCAALLLTGCNGVERGADGSNAALTPDAWDAAPVLDGKSIRGEWDIVSFDGYAPARLSGSVRAAFADFGPGDVRLRIECNYSGRAGKVENGRFVASTDNDRIQTLMGCGPEREARDERYFSFFDRKPKLERVSNSRIRLVADGIELILERPAVRRLAYLPSLAELQGKWRMVELTRYETGGYSGIGLSEVPGRIVFTGDTVAYSRCPQYAVRFQLSADGRLARQGGAEAPADPKACGELADAAGIAALPDKIEILRLLHANPRVEQPDAKTILLATDRHALLLTTAACESLEQSDDHRTTTIQDCASPE